MVRTILAILGIIFIAGILMAIAFRKGLLANTGINDLLGGNSCDPSRVGYRMDGTKDSKCGQVPCDPARPGLDMDGFADFNCGFGARTSGTSCSKGCDTKYAYNQNYWNNLYRSGQMSYDQWKAQIAIITGEYDCCLTKCKNPNATC